MDYGIENIGTGAYTANRDIDVVTSRRYSTHRRTNSSVGAVARRTSWTWAVVTALGHTGWIRASTRGHRFRRQFREPGEPDRARSEERRAKGRGTRLWKPASRTFPPSLFSVCVTRRSTQLWPSTCWSTSSGRTPSRSGNAPHAASCRPRRDRKHACRVGFQHRDSSRAGADGPGPPATSRRIVRPDPQDPAEARVLIAASFDRPGTGSSTNTRRITSSAPPGDWNWQSGGSAATHLATEVARRTESNHRTARYLTQLYSAAQRHPVARKTVEAAFVYQGLYVLTPTSAPASRRPGPGARAPG